MKKANIIISHILHLPQFKSLQSHYCYKKFISLLSKKFQKAISFVYVRSNTLFVALSHPGYKMELNYNKDLLKSILSLLRKEEERCKFLVANRVVLFNPKYKTVGDTKSENTIPNYEEMALGDFKIDCKDRDIRDIFETIRDDIIEDT